VVLMSVSLDYYVGADNYNHGARGESCVWVWLGLLYGWSMMSIIYAAEMVVFVKGD
jgi:hypothetical protein